MMAGIATAACVTLSTGSAQANPIDNSGLNCTFKFDQNGSIPFLDFSNGKSATDLSTVNYFTADTDSAGNMGFVGSTMQAVPTNALVNGHTVSVRLLFTDVVGTTDLSGTDAYIDWEMTAKAQFVDATDGISTVNCQTGTFTIYVTGDWDATTSSAFTIPALSGSGSGACNGWSSAVNTALGLGTSGATLTLYKFRGYNGATQLYGS